MKITIERETLRSTLDVLTEMPPSPGKALVVSALRAALAAQPAEAQPVAWRHSKTGRLYDSVEEVPLADGDESAEPLYAAPAAQQAPAAWRQWSTKLHDWDYQTNRGDLRPDTPADPLFVAAAQLVPLTDEQRNDRIEAWSSQGWGDRLGEVVRICIAIERAVLEAQPADAQQEPVAWRVRAKTLEQLLTRAIDHVSYGSRRSYDGVGGYKMREAASHLLSEIVAALAAIVAPPAQPEGGIVVSKNEAGQIVCVSRQDEDGQFLSIIAESADAVPPGYALVPIEPTPEMLDAGDVARHSVLTQARTSVIYRAMIAAAGDKV